MGPSVQTIELPAVLGIAEAATLHDQFLEAVAAGGDICLDLSATGRMDTTGLQLILSLERTLALADRRLLFNGDSALLREELQGLGLAGEIDIPDESAPA